MTTVFGKVGSAWKGRTPFVLHFSICPAFGKAAYNKPIRSPFCTSGRSSMAGQARIAISRQTGAVWLAPPAPGTKGTGLPKVKPADSIHRRPVFFAEVVHMNKKRIKLVQGTAVVVAGLQREGLVIGFDKPGREAAEELHIRHLDLPVGVVDRRVDQHSLVAVGEEVAAP